MCLENLTRSIVFLELSHFKGIALFDLLNSHFKDKITGSSGSIIMTNKEMNNAHD